MDYFNEKERDKQKKFASYRDKCLSPLLGFFEKISLQPNHLTYVGVLFLVIACLMPVRLCLLAGLFLILYLFMDALDGGLARRLGLTHQGGSIMDIWGDQMGVILIPAAAVYHLNSDPVSAILFSNGYVIFIMLMVFVNYIGLHVHWFARVKYPLYVFYIVCAYFEADYISIFFQVCALYYWIEIILILNKIHKYYSNLNE